jgi:hypothetical protein
METTPADAKGSKLRCLQLSERGGSDLVGVVGMTFTTVPEARAQIDGLVTSHAA